MRVFRDKRADLNKPKYWRRRAERAQADADGAADRKVKRMLLGFAEGYEKMAKRIEKLSAK